MPADILRRARDLLTLAARSQPSFAHLLRALFVPRTCWYDSVVGQVLRGNHNRARYLAMFRPDATTGYSWSAPAEDTPFLLAVASYTASSTLVRGVRAIFARPKTRSVVTILGPDIERLGRLAVHRNVQEMREIAGWPPVAHTTHESNRYLPPEEIRNRFGLDVGEWTRVWSSGK